MGIDRAFIDQFLDNCEDNLDQVYILGTNDCDIWGENRMKDNDAKIPNGWNSSKDSCQEHIKNMRNLGTINKLTKDTNLSEGLYAILMQNTDHLEQQGHFGFIFIKSNGKVTFYEEGGHRTKSNKTTYGSLKEYIT